MSVNCRALPLPGASGRVSRPVTEGQRGSHTLPGHADQPAQLVIFGVYRANATGICKCVLHLLIFFMSIT